MVGLPSGEAVPPFLLPVNGTSVDLHRQGEREVASRPSVFIRVRYVGMVTGTGRGHWLWRMLLWHHDVCRLLLPSQLGIGSNVFKCGCGHWLWLMLSWYPGVCWLHLLGQLRIDSHVSEWCQWRLPGVCQIAIPPISPLPSLWRCSCGSSSG